MAVKCFNPAIFIVGVFFRSMALCPEAVHRETLPLIVYSNSTRHSASWRRKNTARGKSRERSVNQNPGNTATTCRNWSGTRVTCPPSESAASSKSWSGFSLRTAGGGTVAILWNGSGKIQCWS